MSKSKEAVALGRRRASKMTALDRSVNARTGWERRQGKDHITADQWRVLWHLRENDVATAEIGTGPSGDRFVEALAKLNDRRIIDVVRDQPTSIIYKRGPSWVDQKHIRVASKKST